MESFRFLWNGRRIIASDSPATLNMLDTEYYINIHRNRSDIIISVIDQVGEEMFFRVSSWTRMSRVFDVYAARNGHDDPGHFHFCVGGEIIEPNQTAMDLGLEDQDQIDVMRKQSGC
jgi:hypothetical protein